ncbi:anaerobic C4-dicarboxylate transporter family protein, partial [Klebsiella pneumoniae]
MVSVEIIFSSLNEVIIMIWVELAIVLLFIFIGARIGGIGIGLAGGAGVIALSLILGVPTKQAFI